ncbi:hypothetical protein EYF80_052105 [Liparis tanakae]|uniref:Uncharacterized protein n=1 Tax=Liparis tanakae TaxID=230148 RepID=A0A4Z2F9W5_9TELE|nr:hypothetical protein EYF80_052105 [Liparis tanakae]
MGLLVGLQEGRDLRVQTAPSWVLQLGEGRDNGVPGRQQSFRVGPLGIQVYGFNSRSRAAIRTPIQQVINNIDYQN